MTFLSKVKAGLDLELPIHLRNQKKCLSIRIARIDSSGKSSSTDNSTKDVIYHLELIALHILITSTR